jgi:helix-turn-helix, Psq domain
MADAFANSPKAERIEKSARAYQQNSRLTARKAAKIYNVVNTTILRRLREITKPAKLSNQARQLLMSVEERTIVKFVVNRLRFGCESQVSAACCCLLLPAAACFVCYSVHCCLKEPR